jgi:hypothetical protein
MRAVWIVLTASAFCIGFIVFFTLFVQVPFALLAVFVPLAIWFSGRGPRGARRTRVAETTTGAVDE